MDKRDALVATAFSLFYREGIHAVGINRILEQSGIAKKTMYHHFPSKDDLIMAVLEFRHERYCQWLEGRVAGVPAGIVGIEAIFTALDDWINDRDATLTSFHGCFFINVSGEFGNPDHPAHQYCAKHKAWVLALMKRQVEAMGLDEKQAEDFAQSLALLKEGAIVLAHVCGQTGAARRAGQTARLLLEPYL